MLSHLQVLAMEEHLLNVLGFELTVPTAKTFLRRFVQAAMHGGEPNLRLEHLASYLTELALLDYGEHRAQSITLGLYLFRRFALARLVPAC